MINSECSWNKKQKLLFWRCTRPTDPQLWIIKIRRSRTTKITLISWYWGSRIVKGPVGYHFPTSPFTILEHNVPVLREKRRYTDFKATKCVKGFVGLNLTNHFTTSELKNPSHDAPGKRKNSPISWFWGSTILKETVGDIGKPKSSHHYSSKEYIQESRYICSVMSQNS